MDSSGSYAIGLIWWCCYWWYIRGRGHVKPVQSPILCYSKPIYDRNPLHGVESLEKALGMLRGGVAGIHYMELKGLFEEKSQESSRRSESITWSWKLHGQLVYLLLSTPCNGFSKPIIVKDNITIEGLSTPCNGFSICMFSTIMFSEYLFQLHVMDSHFVTNRIGNHRVLLHFQLHVMDSISHVKIAKPTTGNLSTPCNGFPRFAITLDGASYCFFQLHVMDSKAFMKVLWWAGGLSTPCNGFTLL